MIEDLVLIGNVLPRILIEMLVAIVCGGLIGLLRRSNEEKIRLSFYIFTCLSSAIFVNLPALVFAGNPDSLQTQYQFSLVIIAAVIISTAFFGGAIILWNKDHPSGIASAASIWMVAWIGIIIGVDQWLLGLLLTCLMLLIIVILKGVENSVVSQPRTLMLKVNTKMDNPELRNQLQKLLEDKGVSVQGFHVESIPGGFKMTIIGSREPEELSTLVSELWSINGITDVEH